MESEIETLGMAHVFAEKATRDLVFSIGRIVDPSPDVNDYRMDQSEHEMISAVVETELARAWAEGYRAGIKKLSPVTQR